MRATGSLVAAALLFLVAPTWALQEGEPAPAFSLSSVEGEAVSLADLSGKAVVLSFWATWGKRCAEELRQLQALADELGEEGLVVLGVNEREDREVILEFARRHQITFPILLDDGSMARDYGVNGVPDLWLLDRQGLLLARFVGYGPSAPAEIGDSVRAAVAEPAAPAVTGTPAPPGTAPGVPVKLQAYAHLQLGAAYLNIGDAFVGAGLSDRGHYETALRELRAALSLDWSNSDLHVWTGMALERTGDRSAAVREYQTAFTLDPVNTYAQQALRRLGAPWTPGVE